MRVLITSTPGAGHLNPIVPLARALASAGHDVVWATEVESCRKVERLGFRAVPSGMSVAERTTAFSARATDVLSLPARRRRAVVFPLLFAEIAAPRMHDDLVAVFDDVAPQVVLHDLAELAAAPLAIARGIPHVTIGFSGALPDELLDGALGAVEPVWASEGVTVSRQSFNGDLLLHPFPSSMDAPRADGPSAPMRPVSFTETDAAEPDGLASFGAERIGIYLTFGTEVAGLAPWTTIFDALADLEVDVLATVGPTLDPDGFDSVPPNIRVERYVPQEFLLGRVSLVVSHAGAGTLIGAASAGRVQLCMPIVADQWDNADRLSAVGAGVTLEPDERDVEIIRRSVEHLLGDEHTLEAARALQTDFASMPHPTDVVDSIEALT